MAFIVFEGIDGSGKSTLLGKLSTHLESVGTVVERTREPGGTRLGDELRQVILEDRQPAPTAKTELLLYQAIRAQHVEERIAPALAQGHWVLSDRFSASSIAFQSGGRGISLDEVKWLNHFSTGGLIPDQTFLLDITYEQAQERMSQRQGDFKDRIEKEAQSFHDRVRNGFLKIAAENKKNWSVLDASQKPEELLKLALGLLKDRGLLL